jgi:hypothetical protein
MTRILALAGVAGLLIGSTGTGFAAGKSKNTPGHLMQQKGPVAGHSGASGYAPGHLKKKTSARGASAYAPGHRK